MSEAVEITKKAKSNLAIAFACLPKQRRKDMITLYAYCRIVDDLADSPTLPREEKIAGLTEWKDCFSENPPKNLTSTQKAILEVRDRYQIDNQLFLEIIEGCESDLNPAQRFGDWEDLKKYTYQVACCVGLISIKVFGCKSPDAEKYAINLGHALQLTNILRDVGEDLADNMRIYLPENDMTRFQYSERDLVGKVYDGRFIAMMQYISERADHYYLEAEKYFPIEDRRALRSSEAMRRIYHGILHKMQDEKFQVFNYRCTLSKPRKIWILLTSFLGI